MWEPSTSASVMRMTLPYRSLPMSKSSEPMPAAERDDQRLDLLVREHLVEPRLLDVQDLALERQDRLVAAVASLLRGAAGRIALDDVELGPVLVALGAVRELAREAGARQHALAADHLARLAGSLARGRGIHRLPDDGLRDRGFSSQ